MDVKEPRLLDELKNLEKFMSKLSNEALVYSVRVIETEMNKRSHKMNVTHRRKLEKHTRRNS